MMFQRIFPPAQAYGQANHTGKNFGQDPQILSSPLNKDYEYGVQGSETLIEIAATRWSVFSKRGCVHTPDIACAYSAARTGLEPSLVARFYRDCQALPKGISLNHEIGWIQANRLELSVQVIIDARRFEANRLARITQKSEISPGLEKKVSTKSLLPCFLGLGLTIEHIMDNKEYNSQSAPGKESPGDAKKRIEKDPKPPAPEIRPVRKVNLDAPDGVKLRRLLITHQAKCGEDLTASAFFSFVINKMAPQVLEARARTKNLLDGELLSSLGFGRESGKHPANAPQNP
jgi:hypothetical protein